MATSATKPNTFRLYLNQEDTALLKALCEVTETSQSESLGKIVAAGLRALKANNYRMTLPLKFKVSDGLEETLGPRGLKPTKETTK